MADELDPLVAGTLAYEAAAQADYRRRYPNPDRECRLCGTIAPETTMEFEQGGHWMRGTFRCWDTDACDRRASGLYVTGDYDDTERDDG